MGSQACSKDVPGVYIGLENSDGYAREDEKSLEELIMASPEGHFES